MSPRFMPLDNSEGPGGYVGDLTLGHAGHWPREAIVAYHPSIFGAVRLAVALDHATPQERDRMLADSRHMMDAYESAKRRERMAEAVCERERPYEAHGE